MAKYLDVCANNQVSNGRNVITWRTVDTAATQRWMILSDFNSAFALDYWVGSSDYGKCDMYEDAPANDADQLITLVPFDTNQNLYMIKLVNHNRFLTAATTDGQVMFWLAANNQTDQVRKFEEYVEPSFNIVDASSTIPVDKYTMDCFKRTAGAIPITSKRVITPPFKVNNARKITNMNLPFTQTSSEIQSFNTNYGSSCKAFAMAALLTYYFKRFISPHCFTQFGWVPPACSNKVVTDAVIYNGKGAFKLVTLNAGNTTLTQLKTKIDKGVPVLLHFKVSDSAYEQHWVVVYGYSGNGTSKSDFFVVDSANTSRTPTPNYGKYFNLDQSSNRSFAGKPYTIEDSYYMTDN